MPSLRPIVFIGPSMPLNEAREILDADFRAPCKRGDLAGIDGGSVVGIIDGVFHTTTAISPREIVQAIRRGVKVFGAASMGALRAAEVSSMVGIGKTYELYRDGALESDDEVALRFDPERLIPLTVPLINVRFAVERLEGSGTISTSTAQSLVAAAVRLHYTERTYRNILREAGLSDKADADALLALLNGCDLKKQDARQLLERLAEPDPDRSATSAAHDLDAADYGRVRRFDHVRLARRTNLDAEIFVWETGDRVPFDDLIEWLKLTGEFPRYASRVALRLLLAGKLSEVTLEAEPSLNTKSAFEQRCQVWGWRTSEEVRVTMTDLGLGLRDVIEDLRGDALTWGLVTTLARRPSAGFLNALRSELYLDDLALKREVMLCASLRFASRVSRPLASADRDWAKSALCRLHGIATWDVLVRRLGDMNVPPRRIDRFVRRLALARAAIEAPQTRRRLRRRHVELADRQFGVHASPKADDESRFSKSIAAALSDVERLKHVIGVTRVGLVNGLSDIAGVFVSQASRPDGTWSSSYGSGKSTTREGAIVGGVMEEVEKWANERFVGEPILGTFTSLRSAERALDPASLDLPFDTRYAPDLTIAWHRCIDLFDGQPILVPLSALACSANAGRNNVFYSQRGGRTTFSTNGLASGFAMADALVHATCEYIERHAAKMAELRIDNPGLLRSAGTVRPLDMSTASAVARRLTADLERVGFRVWAWDITADVRVPSVFVRIIRDGVASPGWATHPNGAVACERALLEACQSHVNVIAGGREDLAVHARSLGRHERPRPSRGPADIRWYRSNKPPVAVEAMQQCVADDVFQEWVWLRQRIKEAGIPHLVAVDLTRDEIQPARVVRVLLPGLETNSPFHCGPRARQLLAADVCYGARDLRR